MKIDDLDLDYRLLRLFLTIYDEGSVTAAAHRLDIGQPTVSHGLDRLRQIIGDPLFVRSGRSIAPTAHADEIAPQVRMLLQGMRSLTRVVAFDPDNADHSAHFVIGANDYEVAVVLPGLMKRLQNCAADVRLKVLSVPGVDRTVRWLRDGTIDHAISIDHSGKHGDIARQGLFVERMRCFYDPAFHDHPPDTLDRYCAASHARVMIGANDSSQIDDILRGLGRSRRTALQVPTFASVANLIRGTDIIATLPSRLSGSMMQGFGEFDLPLDFPEYGFAQYWHVRNAANAAHKWLRGEIFRVSRGLGEV
ncbi:LysR family transcriptional regulator [Thalassospira sp. HJ]|uniref:LysR family transcriptional regulator n=1 Tax=Thalassospira sp. HJ TaxID=1616823 RepID=UPI0005CF0EE9|nr:LysR family transcriptional regulator [Thalassospira sp. HJ]KJE35070.1 LysR family transcriptional regulator [Thalassospira sp. HJ]